MVEGWDGEEDGDDEDNGLPNETDVPIPPERVKEVYKRATQHIESLKSDPDDSMAETELDNLNAEIRQGNRNEGVEEDTWNIPVSFLVPQYRLIMENNRILDKDPTRKHAASAVAMLKRLIDMHIERNHLPKEWTIIERNQESTVVQEGPETSGTTKRAWEYPWATGLTSDNWTIVGVTPMGKKDEHGRSKSHMVLIETMDGSKDGIPYQKYVSATDAGLASVERYIDTPGHKCLSEAPGTWSYKDRDDFVKLLCVSDGRTKVHNTATRGKAVPTKCTVEFKRRGISVLSATDFYKVLGRRRGIAQVEKFCKENGYPPPWERTPMDSIHKPTAYSKTGPAKQGRIDHSSPAVTKSVYTAVITPGNGTTSHSAPPIQDRNLDDMKAKMSQMDARVAGVEAKVDEMETKFTGVEVEIRDIKAMVARLLALVQGPPNKS